MFVHFHFTPSWRIPEDIQLMDRRTGSCTQIIQWRKYLLIDIPTSYILSQTWVKVGPFICPTSMLMQKYVSLRLFILSSQGLPFFGCSSIRLTDGRFRMKGILPPRVILGEIWSNFTYSRRHIGMSHILYRYWADGRGLKTMISVGGWTYRHVSL